MHLGKLGEQIVFKSKDSFSHLRFLRAEPVEDSVYFEKKKNRDTEARQAYRKPKAHQTILMIFLC